MNASVPGAGLRKRIAVIGSGISGMAAAYFLSRSPQHEVHVYEAGARPGGHTATIDVNHEGEQLAIDTGFIVFNDRTYPQFVALLDTLGIASRPTTMSFSVSAADSGIEYAGTNFNTVFAQRANLLSPRFLCMLRDILRFNRDVEKHLQLDPALEQATLGDYLQRFGYSPQFSAWYLLPMGAAIWSSDQSSMEAFPLAFFVRFFRNHGLLDLHNRPQWRVIEGGSRAYIAPLIAPFRERLHLNTPVHKVQRGLWLQGRQQVCVSSTRGAEFFDAIVFACHSDQTLRLLDMPTAAERQLLGAIPYTRNEVVLHHDISLLPRARRTWSSWNVSLGRNSSALPALTYNMNILQGLHSRHTWCVTLNQTASIDSRKIHSIYHYDHPLFTLAGSQAQQRLHAINGHLGSWYCGAWLGNGFHEDGVSSAQRTAAALTAETNRALALAGHA